MHWRKFSLVLALMLPTLFSVVTAADRETDDGSDSVSKLVQNYCIDCHSSVDPQGNFVLEDLVASATKRDANWQTSTWEKILKRLKGRQMPPADAERPSDEMYLSTIETIEGLLDAHAEQYPRPGRTDSIRRLNRTEYQNAIRDLLGLEIHVEDLLPADELSHGFDNVTVGELSPVLLNRYLTAAKRISRLAVGATQQSPGGVTIRLPADRSQETHVQGLPFGTLGGTLITHHFPADGEYEIQILLMRDRDEFVEGLTEPHDLHVLLDKQLVESFTVHPSKNKDRWRRDDSKVDAHLRKRISVTAGAHDVGVTFPKKFASLQEIKRQPFETNFNKHRHPRRSPAVFQVSIVGPFNAQGPGVTSSRSKIFGDVVIDENNPAASARKILEPITRIAYRRPVTDADLSLPMKFFHQNLNERGFEAGIESALAMVLVNPHFLFRSEKVPANLESGDVYPISDLELASRLSFFIWSSLPDNELLTLAADEKLSQPEILQSQVRRMLSDERSQSLVTNFATQWLYLKNLDNFRPDMRLFPDFDDNLRQAMRQETEFFFASIVNEDRSVLDLLDSNTTFLNERLAKHYGISHVIGSHFRLVELDAESHRGGLLRHASILAVTSYATRTSPTIRGNWILENILGTPAPPPPPNVPALKEKTIQLNTTIRERLAEHRANAACASCHNLMDPLGFSLENFDAVGRWRNFEAGQPIDSTGALPNGQPVRSLDELERGILAHPELFVETLTAKLLTFALGRGIELSDGPAIREIVRRSAHENYRFSSLIQGIAASQPFQMREKE